MTRGKFLAVDRVGLSFRRFSDFVKTYTKDRLTFLARV